MVLTELIYMLYCLS